MQSVYCFHLNFLWVGLLFGQVSMCTQANIAAHKSRYNLTQYIEFPQVLSTCSCLCLRWLIKLLSPFIERVSYLWYVSLYSLLSVRYSLTKSSVGIYTSTCWIWLTTKLSFWWLHLPCFSPVCYEIDSVLSTYLVFFFSALNLITWRI